METNDELASVAFERCPSGLVVVDGSGRIVRLNCEIERIFGYPRTELLGHSIEILVPEQARGRHVAQRTQYEARPETRLMGAGRELTGRRRDGTEVAVEVGLNVVETQSGRFILGTVVDVTQRRSLEEALRQAQTLELTSRLVGGIAHDFNNILQAIIGNAELVREELEDPEAALADVEVIAEAGRAGRDLVKRMLAFVRPGTGVMTFVDVNEVVTQVVRLLRPTLPRSITLRLELSDDAMTVRAPLADIEQVALNLIQNAISAMKQSGGTLEVRTLATTMPRSGTSTASSAEPVPVVQLAVSDTGVGIQKEHLSKIFEPFFTTKPVGEGRGFGLSVVARIAHSLGGWVSVNSVVDEGSRFDLYLPAIDPPAAQTTEVPRVTAKSMRILLVEDDERLAQLSERVLRQDGHDVRVFTSSPSALEAFHKAPKDFDLVITDNTMPEMTGPELAERIAQIRPSLPILLVSGITDTLSMDELHRRGIRHALSKPYSAEELRAVLGSLTQ